ncbi:hypothetical protein LLG96_04400 [bacterium]|nr:hypothetical protein [bacterium]
MKSLEQIQESIDRFRRSFWDRAACDRPPVGVSSEGSNMPINYLRRELHVDELNPDDVNAGLCMSDYEYISPERRVVSDDWIPFSAAWRAIPWLEAMCGCPVRYASGSLAPGHWVDSAADLTSVALPVGGQWLDCMKKLTEDLAASVPPDCWISPSILRGPSDVIAAMRGLTGFFCDLYDNPRAVDEMASRVNRLFLDVLKLHFSLVGPKLGGYGHIYGYWAPGRTITIQEDALGMCSPDVYRAMFMKYNIELVENLGPYIFFHLHSTGFQHYRDVLRIPGLAGLEITIEENGPRLRDMIPVLREILERSRLIVFVYHFFEDLPEVLRSIPHDGLYMVISDKFIRSEDEFGAFIKNHWKR